MFRVSLGVAFPHPHIAILEGEKTEETVATRYDDVAASGTKRFHTITMPGGKFCYST